MRDFTNGLFKLPTKEERLAERQGASLNPFKRELVNEEGFQTNSLDLLVEEKASKGVQWPSSLAHSDRREGGRQDRRGEDKNGKEKFLQSGSSQILIFHYRYV